MVLLVIGPFFQYGRMIEESDSHALKGSVQTRHTQTTFSSPHQKNYRQEATYKCSPDDNRF